MGWPSLAQWAKRDWAPTPCRHILSHFCWRMCITAWLLIPVQKLLSYRSQRCRIITSSLKIWQFDEVPDDFCAVLLRRCTLLQPHHYRGRPLYLSLKPTFKTFVSKHADLNLNGWKPVLARVQIKLGLKPKLETTVVSSEIISGNFGKFIPIFPEISGNLLITYVNQLFQSPALQSDAV